VFTGLLGVVLWIQIVVPSWGVLTSNGDLMPFVAMVPLFVLGVSVVLRASLGLLLAFPLSLMPVLAVLTPSVALDLQTPGTLVRVVATMALFLAVSSAWTASKDAVDVIHEDLSDPHPERGSRMKRYVHMRIPVMVLLFLVPMYGVYLDNAIVSTIAQSHPDANAVGQTFVAVLMFFAWAVMAYSLFVVPALNLEYDRRRLMKRIEGLRLPYSRRWLRVAVECGAVGGVCVVLSLM
jgi:hypothetical protein